MFMIYSVIEKIASDGPKWDPRSVCPTNPDLADIFGRTDLNSDMFFDPKILHAAGASGAS